MMAKQAKVAASSFAGLNVDVKRAKDKPNNVIQALTLQAHRVGIELQAQVVWLPSPLSYAALLTACC